MRCLQVGLLVLVVGNGQGFLLVEGKWGFYRVVVEASGMDAWSWVWGGGTYRLWVQDCSRIELAMQLVFHLVGCSV